MKLEKNEANSTVWACYGSCRMQSTVSSLIVLDPAQEKRGILPWRCLTEIHILGTRMEKSAHAWAQERALSAQARLQWGSRVLSLAHSQGVVAVWVVSSGASWVDGGAGLDFEFSDRTLSTRAVQRICTSEEHALTPALSPLEFWVLKEAAFKTQGREAAQGVAHAWRLTAVLPTRVMRLENESQSVQAVFPASALFAGTALQGSTLALAVAPSPSLSPALSP